MRNGYWSFPTKFNHLHLYTLFHWTQRHAALLQTLNELVNASLHSIDTFPFVVECDASDVAILVTLTRRWTVVSSCRKRSNSNHQSYTKWKDLLLRQHFELVTDQQFVAFMLDNRRRSKIKDNKIQSWRIELASLS